MKTKYWYKRHTKQRLHTYFHKRFNEEGDTNIVLEDLKYSKSHQVFGYCWNIKFEEVKKDIHKGKGEQPDKIPVKFCKIADIEGIDG